MRTAEKTYAAKEPALVARLFDGVDALLDGRVAVGRGIVHGRTHSTQHRQDAAEGDLQHFRRFKHARA